MLALRHSLRHADGARGVAASIGELQRAQGGAARARERRSARRRHRRVGDGRDRHDRRDQRIVLFNAAAERGVPWPRDAVIGQPLDKLIPERFRGEPHAGTSSASAATGVTSRAWATQTVLWACAPNGEEFPIEASISQHSESGQQALHRDPARRHRARSVRGAARAQRGAAARHPRFGDGRDHHRRRAASISCCSTPRRRRCSAARASEAIGAPLAWFIPRAVPRTRTRRTCGASARRHRARAAWARSASSMGLRRNGEEFPIEASISQTSEHGEQLLHGDPARRHRARAGRRGAARSKEEIRELALAARPMREQEKSRIARELHDELGAGAYRAARWTSTWLQGERRPPISGRSRQARIDAANCWTRRSRPRAGSRPTCGR